MKYISWALEQKEDTEREEKGRVWVTYEDWGDEKGRQETTTFRKIIGKIGGGR